MAVIAFFRTLGVDKRLSILLEGESLINDGVAVVLFTLAVAAAGSAAAPPTLSEGLFEFVRVAGGGILVGLATGLVAAQIVSRLDDRLVETTLSMALAFGSFVAAQSLGVSGILAVADGRTGNRQPGLTEALPHHSHHALQLLGPAGVRGQLSRLSDPGPANRHHGAAGAHGHGRHCGAGHPRQPGHRGLRHGLAQLARA